MALVPELGCCKEAAAIDRHFHQLVYRYPARYWLFGLLLAASGMAPLAAKAPPGPTKRIPWENRRLVGSPEPPPPYTVEKTFTKIAWKEPMYLVPEPGADHLWVVLRNGEKDRPARIVRLHDDPQAERVQTVLERADHLIYAVTFHPAYATNRYCYVFLNGPTGAAERTNRVLRYTVTRQAPFTCDPRSEKLIIQWRSMGHDGGDLAFGKDGMLYITAGDGTSDSDGWDSGQDVSNLLATLIRIDVDHPEGNQPYRVPNDNPFVNRPGARPEIWAYGFRNPWRMCVDAQTGDVWVGNNGQDLWETAYLVRRGDNFGWSVYEGSHPFQPQRRRGPTPIVPPTIEHSHAEFRSLTGGVVYYGKRLPELAGTYIYGDYSTGKIWGARHRDGKLVWHQELTDTSLQIVAFSVDQRGDLLIADLGGGIYRLVPKRPDPHAPKFPSRLSETGLFTSLKDQLPAPGLIPYTVNAPAWMDGAVADRWLALPPAVTIKYGGSRAGNFDDGAVLVQTIALETAKGNPASRRRIETRVMLKQEGEWTGYSYRWNEAQTDALLVGKEGAQFDLVVHDQGVAGASRRQTWRIPSRADCMGCHSRAANFVLGIHELQLNRPASDGKENQLAMLARLGVLAEAPSTKPEQRGRLVNPYDDRADVDQRARSYLQANCSVCHVEAGGGNARMELEYTRPRAQMNLISAWPQHDTFGMSDAMLVTPGKPERSILLQRLSRRGRGQMPPLGTLVVDAQAVTLFRAWIAALKPEHAFVRAWTMNDLLPALHERSPGRSVANGKRLFQSVGCAQCHRLGNEGGALGPDLTGVSRRLKPVDVLESILEPSKVIADAYANAIIETQTGEVVTGRVEREDGPELVVRTGSGAAEIVRIAKTNIAGRRKSPVSPMPAGIVNVLERNEVLDLLAYLLADQPANGQTAKN